MTSEFCRGLDFEAATLERPALRQTYAETLWRFVFTSNLIHGTFNADPHPGNYLFHEDGRVTFLDFGCMQVLSESYRANLRLMHLAVLHADRAGFSAAARAAFETVAGDYESALIGYVFRCYEPLKRAPFRVAYSSASTRCSLVSTSKRTTQACTDRSWQSRRARRR
jgi:hypothetical protein